MKKINLALNLAVIILREKDRFVAYSPALDLSSSGKNYEQAKKRFTEAASLFFEEIIAKNTVNEALEELGWQKIRKEWRPPTVISQETETVRIPALA